MHPNPKHAKKKYHEGQQQQTAHLPPTLLSLPFIQLLCS
jgi:hypothetical protein